jgi:phosphatidylglycerophosphate synthase
MIKPSDGYFARWFDRKISLAISRMLVRTPITPNVISFVTMLIGLTGAWLISLGTYWAGVAGTAVFALSTILDGCDGEVARLKFQQSPFGSILDAVIDNVVYLSVMVSIAYVSIRANPETNYYLLFGLLAAGMAVTTAVIFGWMNRVRDSSRAQLFLERLANGDFSYLVLGFAVAGHLEYFLWAAAFGVHAFYLILIAILVWR